MISFKIRSFKNLWAPSPSVLLKGRALTLFLLKLFFMFCKQIKDCVILSFLVIFLSISVKLKRKDKKNLRFNSLPAFFVIFAPGSTVHRSRIISCLLSYSN